MTNAEQTKIKEEELIENLSCDELCILGGKERKDLELTEITKEKIFDKGCVCSLNQGNSKKKR